MSERDLVRTAIAERLQGGDHFPSSRLGAEVVDLTGVKEGADGPVLFTVRVALWAHRGRPTGQVLAAR